jgi:aldehyde dehydrogenase (NAD+)
MTQILTQNSTPDIQRVFALQRSKRWERKASTAEQRKAILLKLKEAILVRTDTINAALNADLRKPIVGAHHPEIWSTLGEIDTAVAHLDAWMQPQPVPLSPMFAGNEAYVQCEPRGVVLLFGPWNYPFSLVFAPLVNILAAGNSAIVKPNEMQPHTSALVAELIRATFHESLVAVFEGGIEVAEKMQQLPADHIFFTGSPAIGKRIMASAARHLTSVTLELGGKNPAIIEKDHDLMDAAGKIVAARFSNAGQLCLAADHVWVHRSQREAFTAIAAKVIDKMFYVDGQLQKERFPRIVDARNLARVKSYIDDALARGARVACGGTVEADDLTIHPTVLVDVPLDAAIMGEEVFGPVLAVLAYDDVREATDNSDKVGKPLALYVFGQPDFVEDVLAHTSSGGVTVNNVLCHYIESNLPFGGVNGSGIGRYKGHAGFLELSNARSVFVQVK